MPDTELSKNQLPERPESREKANNTPIESDADVQKKNAERENRASREKLSYTDDQKKLEKTAVEMEKAGIKTPDGNKKNSVEKKTEDFTKKAGSFIDTAFAKIQPFIESMSELIEKLKEKLQPMLPMLEKLGIPVPLFLRPSPMKVTALQKEIQKKKGSDGKNYELTPSEQDIGLVEELNSIFNRVKTEQTARKDANVLTKREFMQKVIDEAIRAKGDPSDKSLTAEECRDAALTLFPEKKENKSAAAPNKPAEKTDGKELVGGKQQVDVNGQKYEIGFTSNALVLNGTSYAMKAGGFDLGFLNAKLGNGSLNISLSTPLGKQDFALSMEQLSGTLPALVSAGTYKQKVGDYELSIERQTA